MASFLADARRILYGPSITVELTEGPQVLSWPKYIWLETLDWVRVMTTPADPNLEPYPLSVVGKTLSALTFMAIVLGGWMLAKKLKRKGRKRG